MTTYSLHVRCRLTVCMLLHMNAASLLEFECGSHWLLWHAGKMVRTREMRRTEAIIGHKDTFEAWSMVYRFLPYYAPKARMLNNRARCDATQQLLGIWTPHGIRLGDVFGCAPPSHHDMRAAGSCSHIKVSISSQAWSTLHPQGRWTIIGAGGRDSSSASEVGGIGQERHDMLHSIWGAGAEFLMQAFRPCLLLMRVNAIEGGEVVTDVEFCAAEFTRFEASGLVRPPQQIRSRTIACGAGHLDLQLLPEMQCAGNCAHVHVTADHAITGLDWDGMLTTFKHLAACNHWCVCSIGNEAAFDGTASRQPAARLCGYTFRQPNVAHLAVSTRMHVAVFTSDCSINLSSSPPSSQVSI